MMAVLTDQSRVALWAEFMQRNSEPISITKQDLRAVVNAMDDWINTNAASLNQAIPQPARGALSASQKALLLQYVVEKRYGDNV